METTAVSAHLLAHGRWVDLAETPARQKLGTPLRCHFSVLDRWRERPGSQAFFGFGLYAYCGQSYWWLHSWLIDSTGTLIDSAERDDQTQYYGVPWTLELLDAVHETIGHEFEDILADGLRDSVGTSRCSAESSRKLQGSGRPSLPRSK